MADGVLIVGNIVNGVALTASVVQGVTVVGTVSAGGAVAANLTTSRDTSTVTINNSSGTSATIAGADSTHAGVVPALPANSSLFLNGVGAWATPAGSGGGTGTVTSVAVTAANGVSGSVANSTTTPAITLSLGAITPTSVAASSTVTGSNLSGTNTGDQDLSGYTPTSRTINTKPLTSNVTLTQDDVASGTTNKAYTATEQTKLAGIATGATANSTDATLLNRANHTGTQAESTVTNLVSDLAAKQATLTLSTTGTSGAATLVGATLNIPQYSAGGGSGITRSVNVIATGTTAGASASTDYVYIVSGTTTLTLPTAVGNTNRYSVTTTDGATTVATTSAQTILGSSTATLPITNMSLDFISNGSNWVIE